ncbi:MAG: glutathione S-transferase N-terminal domain-containing protein [Verrucomicrobiota bacterium]|nr:glutathione S-transferase N-terminal domain-containing protein [Verrucomicrobiota bacterium]
MKPLLYVKKGCPWCKEATDYLDQRKIDYTKIDVRDDATQMQKLKDISGQAKTPTLDWDGAVLANFGVEELERFLEKRKAS